MIVGGVDIGSVWTKAVILRDEKIISYAIESTGMRMGEIAKVVFQEALDKAGLDWKDIERIIATGYGRVRVPWAARQVTEITCHGKAASWWFPSARTVVDIGGQDSKVIKLDANGDVANFIMNDKCASGTGRFIEVMAHAIGVGLPDMGKIALSATRKIHISSTCTVFAESEVISLVSQGELLENIVAGIFESITERVYHMVRAMRPEKDYVLSGGVGKNIGVVRALEEKIGSKLLIPEEPIIGGALGACLIAASDCAVEGVMGRGTK